MCSSVRATGSITFLYICAYNTICFLCEYTNGYECFESCSSVSCKQFKLNLFLRVNKMQMIKHKHMNIVSLAEFYTT